VDSVKGISTSERPVIWRSGPMCGRFGPSDAIATLDLAEHPAFARTFAAPDPGSFRQLWLGLDCEMAEVASVIFEEDLGIEVSCLADGVEVALRGELDLATASALHEHLSDLAAQGWIDIVLDIAELRYIDAVGLSLLIMTQKRVKQMGGSLVVRHPTRSALKLFGATGLTENLMGVGCSRTQAVGALQHQQQHTKENQ